MPFGLSYRTPIFLKFKKSIRFKNNITRTQTNNKKQFFGELLFIFEVKKSN